MTIFDHELSEKARRRTDGRSALQRQGNAAMTQVMKAWEALSDEQRLTWEVAGSNRRRKAINYFKQVNLRRLRGGEALASVPPRPKLCDTRPLLKGLNIRNRGGRITLELQLWRAPDGPRTVWASLPSNLGLKKPHSCPRLGWLPAPQGRWSEFTKLYFKKHGEYLKRHGLPLVGKRIFIRLRQELDDGPPLYEQVKAVVPQPEVPIGKKGLSSSKDHRILFEGPSNALRNNTRTSRGQHAARTPLGGAEWRRGRRNRKPSAPSPK